MEDGKFLEGTQKEVMQGSLKKVLKVIQTELQENKLSEIFRRNSCKFAR